MNLLAHALLTPPSGDPGVLVGNLTADWIKGRARHTLPDDLRAGIDLHRRIDAFTDTHPMVESACGLLANRWGRYAPVLIDILFDHLLSCDWRLYCPMPRQDFIAHTYSALRDHLHLLPERAQYASHALLADDWLNAYASLDGIALSLTRLSHRLHHGIELAAAVADFRFHRPALQDAFHHFFPLLRQHLAHPSPCRDPASEFNALVGEIP